MSGFSISYENVERSRNRSAPPRLQFDATRYRAKECFEYGYTNVSRSGVPFARKSVNHGPCKVEDRAACAADKPRTSECIVPKDVIDER